MSKFRAKMMLSLLFGGRRRVAAVDAMAARVAAGTPEMYNDNTTRWERRAKEGARVMFTNGPGK